MSIKQKPKCLKISKGKIERRECSAKELTIIFSFHHITSCTDYNFIGFNKQKKNSETVNCIIQLVDKLKKMSQLTWDQFHSQHRKAGYEYVNTYEMDEAFVNHLDITIPKDEKLLVVRFNGQNSRFILKRGTKCNRVAHFLGLDYNLKLYKH